MIVAFRRHTLLPLDDCLYALQPSIPSLTRSSLHRCLQRHGISRLPDVAGDKPKRQKFKRYPIGFFHIDVAEVQTAEGKLYLFVGICWRRSERPFPLQNNLLRSSIAGGSGKGRPSLIPLTMPPCVVTRGYAPPLPHDRQQVFRPHVSWPAPLPCSAFWQTGTWGETRNPTEG